MTWVSIFITCLIVAWAVWLNGLVAHSKQRHDWGAFWAVFLGIGFFLGMFTLATPVRGEIERFPVQTHLYQIGNQRYAAIHGSLKNYIVTANKDNEPSDFYTEVRRKYNYWGMQIDNQEQVFTK